jgi:hypothetical protein
MKAELLFIHQDLESLGIPRERCYLTQDNMRWIIRELKKKPETVLVKEMLLLSRECLNFHSNIPF